MSLVKIEASFDPSNPNELNAAVNFLKAIGGNPVGETTQKIKDIPVEEAEEVKATPRKRAPRKKKVVEAKEVVEAKKQLIWRAGSPKEVVEGKDITLTDIREATSKKVKEHREVIKAKLNEWSVPNVGQIPKEKYEDFKTFLDSL